LIHNSGEAKGGQVGESVPGRQMRIKIDHLLILIFSLMLYFYVIQNLFLKKYIFGAENMSSYYKLCLYYVQTKLPNMPLAPHWTIRYLYAYNLSLFTFEIQFNTRYI